MHRSLFILTLVWLSFITMGDPYSMECFSDYLSMITCSLNISDGFLGNESSNWLHFRTIFKNHDCTLKMKDQSLLCELDLSPDAIFTDLDRYTISLHSCYHGNSSVTLNDKFMPHKHIRPIPPSNLSVLWEKDRVLFQWQSGYRKPLTSHMVYQLNVSSQHKHCKVEVDEQKVYMDESRFDANTHYTVRVRSQPNQVYYKGVWSLWSPAVQWRSGDIHKESPEGSLQTAWFLLLLLLPLFLVLLSCIPYKIWRKHEHIPSPAPYFKDWEVNVQMRSVLSGKECDVMRGEESLQIAILTTSEDPPPHETFDYERMRESEGAESPSMPQSPVGSEVDSGCWIRDFVATERGSITCSEDYCTLSNSHNYGI